MKPKYLLLTALLSTSSLFSSAGVEVISTLLCTGGPEILSPQERLAQRPTIALRNRGGAICVSLLESLVSLNRLQRAMEVFTQLSQREFCARYEHIVEVVIRTNSREFLLEVLQSAPETISLHSCNTLLFVAMRDQCDMSYLTLLEYFATILPFEELIELRFSMLLKMCYYGYLQAASREIAWLKSIARDFNIPSSDWISAGRMISNSKGKKKYVISSLVSQHSLPILAALDTSQSEIVDLLLSSNTNPRTLDHQGVSALSFLRAKLDALKKYEPEKSAKKGLHALWQEEVARTRELLCRLTLFVIMGATKKSMETEPLVQKALKKYEHEFQEDDVPLLLSLIRSPEHKKHVIAAVALKLCPALAHAAVRDNEGNNPLHAAVESDNGYLADLLTAINPALMDIANTTGISPIDLAFNSSKWNALAGMAAIESDTKEARVLSKAIEMRSERAAQAIMKRSPWLAHTIPADKTSQAHYANIVLYLISRGRLDVLRTMLEGINQAPSAQQISSKPTPNSEPTPTIQTDRILRKLVKEKKRRDRELSLQASPMSKPKQESLDTGIANLVVNLLNLFK